MFFPRIIANYFSHFSDRFVFEFPEVRRGIIREIIKPSIFDEENYKAIGGSGWNQIEDLQGVGILQVGKLRVFRH